MVPSFVHVVPRVVREFTERSVWVFLHWAHYLTLYFPVVVYASSWFRSTAANTNSTDTRQNEKEATCLRDTRSVVGGTLSLGWVTPRSLSKILVLDLDETLFYASLHPPPWPTPHGTTASKAPYVITPGGSALVGERLLPCFLTPPSHTVFVESSIYFVQERPFLRWFLHATTELGYQLYVFTAARTSYAHAMMRALQLDTWIPFSRVHCRGQCTYVTLPGTGKSGGAQPPFSPFYAKDLRKLFACEAWQTRTVHVDNDARCFRYNPENGLWVPSFCGLQRVERCSTRPGPGVTPVPTELLTNVAQYQEDVTLLCVYEILRALRHVHDIRNVLKSA